jgi:malonyl-CoA/methylmalonyl-CoA synthetase
VSGDLWSAIAAVAARDPEAPALIWSPASAAAPDGVISQAQLVQTARRAAAALSALGVAPGDRVAVGLHNSPELVAALLGTIHLGAVYVPLNPAFTGDEAAYIAGDVDARVVIAHPALKSALASVQPRLRDRVVETLPESRGGASGRPSASAAAALIVYTSGTTGRPKGAVLSHRALQGNLGAITRAWEWTAADRLLLTLPCSHLHGLALGLLASFLAGSSVVLRPRFVAEDVPGDLERSACTMFFGVPTMYNRLVQLPGDEIRRRNLDRMRLWACGSAPLLPTTFERFRAVFGATLLERFGMSEGGFMIAAPYRGERRAGVVGLPVEGVELRVVDEERIERDELLDVAEGASGELVVRGENLFDGYWNDPTATRAAFVGGWFRTGDLAVRESDGQLRIAGRRSADIIKSRGYKVSAVEIEDRMQSFPGVREVAVVGVAHADWGQEIVAVVAPDPEHPPTAEELLARAREVLAAYKVPTRIEFTDEIPKVGPGKFRKNELVRLLT